MQTSIRCITPQMAESILASSRTQNRNIKPSVVARYAEDMLSGRWRLTHQGIALDPDGNLMDGQHRLSAIVRAGIPVNMMVTEGVDKNSMMSIDEGIKRTAGDALQFQGIKASALSVSIIGVFLRSLHGWDSSASRASVLEMREKFLEPLEKVCEFMRGSHSNSLASPAAIGAVLLRALVLHPERSDDLSGFTRVLIEGPNHDTPKELYVAYKLREALIRNAKGRGIYSQKSTYRKTQNAVSAFLRGRELAFVRDTTQELFPLPAFDTPSVSPTDQSISGVKGAYLDQTSGRWKAVVRYDGRSKHLGSFPSEDRAMAAVKSWKESASSSY